MAMTIHSIKGNTNALKINKSTVPSVSGSTLSQFDA